MKTFIIKSFVVQSSKFKLGNNKKWLITAGPTQTAGFIPEINPPSSFKIEKYKYKSCLNSDTSSRRCQKKKIPKE